MLPLKNLRILNFSGDYDLEYLEAGLSRALLGACFLGESDFLEAYCKQCYCLCILICYAIHFSCGVGPRTLPGVRNTLVAGLCHEMFLDSYCLPDGKVNMSRYGRWRALPVHSEGLIAYSFHFSMAQV